MLNNILVIVIQILMIVSIVAFWHICYSALKVDIKSKLITQYNAQKNKSIANARNNIDKRKSYESARSEMYAIGIKYRMGDNFTTFDYMVLKVVVSIAGAIISMLVHPLLSPVGAIIGYYVLPYYFNSANKSDNKSMMEDLRNIYGLVSLQLGNGVHLSKIIYECSLNATNKRLSKALLEFSMDIENFSMINDACEQFRSKFTNANIDAFSKSIEQAQNTGNTIQLLEDMQKKIDGISDAIYIKKEEHVKSICFLFTTIIFFAGCIMLLYIFNTCFTDGNLMVF